MKILPALPAISNNLTLKNQNKNSAQNLRELKFDSVSFGAKWVPTPIYLVDINNTKNIKRYADFNDATKETGISRGLLQANIKGKTTRTGQYFAFLASDFEYYDKNHNRVLDEEKFQAAIEKKQEVIQQKIAQRQVQTPQKRRNITPALPIYLININNPQSYKRYDNVIKAASDTSINPIGISSCLNGKQNKVDKYIVLWAADIETTDENGQTQLDEEKFKKLYMEKSQPLRKKAPKPIYLVKTDDLSCRERYESIYQASYKNHIAQSSIYECLNGNRPTVGGKYVFMASDIETIDSFGIAHLDEEKLEEKYSAMKDRKPRQGLNVLV